MNKCRSCQSTNLSLVHDFGLLPDAGDFQPHPNSGETIPLRLLSCSNCNLLQVDGSVDRVSIYKNYKYTSSSSPLLVKHFEDLACYINSLGSQLKILEIGSNDGTLLKMLSNSNHFCLGVDPSDVALNASSSMDYLLINDFMSSELSKSIVDKYGKFDVIVSCNSFAHNDEIFDIATSVSCLLDDNGVFVVEVQDADRLFTDNQFDTIYREHVCYFSRSTLSYLLSLAGLNTVSCLSVPIHNGSIRLTAKKTVKPSSIDASVSPSPQQLVYDTSGFSSAIKTIQNMVDIFIAKNMKIAAYGASGRCTNILCLAGFDSSHISAVFDSADSKIGLYIPTTDIPIVAKDHDLINSFDCILISAWNYSHQIIHELRSDYSFSGHIIIPLPTPRIIS